MTVHSVPACDSNFKSKKGKVFFCIRAAFISNGQTYFNI